MDLGKNLTYQQGQNSWEYEVLMVKGKTMRIVIMTAITAVALPFMALGQTTEEPQQTQEQTKDTQTTGQARWGSAGCHRSGLRY